MSAAECDSTPSSKPEGSIGKAMEPEMGRLTETDEYPVALGTASTQCPQADAIIRKVCVHLLPKFFLLTVTSYVDRWAAALGPIVTSRCSYMGMWTSICRATEHDRTRLT